MKVAFITGAFPADTAHLEILANEVELTVYGSRHRLSNYGYQPEPPGFCTSRSFRPAGQPVKGHVAWYYRGLSRALSIDQPDLVHLVSEPWGLLALQTSAWARRNPATALVVNGADTRWHTPGFGHPAKRVARRKLARFGLARADAYASENEVSITQARLGGLPRNAPAVVAHTNPRSPQVFRPASSIEERGQLRRSLGLPSQGLGVGFVGRLVPEKGPLLLLDAWMKVRSELLNGHAWLAIAGGGPVLNEIKASAPEEAIILESLDYPHQVADFYRCIDVFVTPPWRTDTWEEQGPRVVIEAMMSGNVVVGSKSGAIPEMVGDTGLLVDQRDVDGLAEAIVAALAIPGDSPSRVRARAHAIDKYSPDAVANVLLKLWRSAHESRMKRTRRPPSE